MENLLLNNLPAIVAGLACVALAAGLGYALNRRDKHLQAFRASLLPGDMVRIKTTQGYVRARIMKKNGSSFCTMIIDTRLPFLATINTIFK